MAGRFPRPPGASRTGSADPPARRCVSRSSGGRNSLGRRSRQRRPPTARSRARVSSAHAVSRCFSQSRCVFCKADASPGASVFRSSWSRVFRLWSAYRSSLVRQARRDFSSRPAAAQPSLGASTPGATSRNGSCWAAAIAGTSTTKKPMPSRSWPSRCVGASYLRAVLGRSACGERDARKPSRTAGCHASAHARSFST